MSDLKAMTLEEAVEIVVNEQDGLDDEGLKRWKRARAIVDQAVRFIGALAEARAEANKEPCDPEAIDRVYDALDKIEAKLRALERGESEVQP